MKIARGFVYAIMPTIFMVAFAPLLHYAYTKTPSSLFPTAEQQAFLNANPAREKNTADWQPPRVQSADFETTTQVVTKCLAPETEVATTSLEAKL